MSSATLGAGAALAPGADDQATRLRALVARELPRELEPGVAIDRPIAPPAPRQGRPKMIVVASGKGGVGKTNIAVNLAHSLALQGRPTTIIDGDLSLGNADLLCGVSPRANFGHVIEGRRRLRDVIIPLGDNLHLLPGTSGVSRLADLSETERRRLVGAFRLIEGGNDVLVVDAGAGIGPWVLALVASADRTLLVTTPEPTAIADAYALVKCVVNGARRRRDALPEIDLVVNQVTGARQAQLVHGRIGAVSDRFLRHRIPLRGWVRYDLKVGSAVRDRRAFVSCSPRCDAAVDVRRVSASLGADLAPEKAPEQPSDGPLVRALRILRVGR